MAMQLQRPSYCNLFLHCLHGNKVSALQSLAVPTGTEPSAVAQAFADHLSQWGLPVEGKPQSACGLPCRMAVRELQVEEGEQNSFSIPIFLAEVSCATLFGMLMITVVPPPNGASLKDLVGASGTPPLRGNQGWVIFADTSGMRRIEIMDAFTQAGCLMEDLYEVYRNPQAEHPEPPIIGEGAYAVVYGMIHRRGTPAAVKKMNISVDLDAIEREVSMLIYARGHDHIVDFYGIFRFLEGDAIRIAVCFELCPHGDVLCEVIRNGPLDEASAKKLFSGLLSALMHIHKLGIIHRDIKAENVLLFSAEMAALADFGLATKTTDTVQMARRCGSPGYVAPEVCLGKPYGSKVDLFGAGVVLYFMLSKEMPFSSPDHDNATTMRKTVKCTLHLRRPPWDGMTSALRGMLRGLICQQADERFSATAAWEHAWLELPAEGLGGSASPSGAAAVSSQTRAEDALVNAGGNFEGGDPSHAGQFGKNDASGAGVMHNSASSIARGGSHGGTPAQGMVGDPGHTRHPNERNTSGYPATHAKGSSRGVVQPPVAGAPGSERPAGY